MDVLCCRGAAHCIFLTGIALLQQTSWSALCIWSGLQPCSSEAVMPVFDHQLGGHTSQHLAPPHTIHLPVLPVVCCVLPNSFSHCCCPDGHHSKQDGGARLCYGEGPICTYRPVVQVYKARLGQIRCRLFAHFCFKSFQ